MELTPAQQGIVALVAQGCPNKEIASRLGVTEATVKTHVGAATKRLGLKNRVQLAVWYVTQRAFSEMPGEPVVPEHGAAEPAPRQIPGC